MWTMVRSFGPADPADAPIGLLGGEQYVLLGSGDRPGQSPDGR